MQIKLLSSAQEIHIMTSLNSLLVALAQEGYD